MSVWSNLVTKKKREKVLAKFVMFVRMSRQQALEVGGVADGDIMLKFSVSENCSSYCYC